MEVKNPRVTQSSTKMTSINCCRNYKLPLGYQFSVIRCPFCVLLAPISPHSSTVLVYSSVHSFFSLVFSLRLRRQNWPSYILEILSYIHIHTVSNLGFNPLTSRIHLKIAFEFCSQGDLVAMRTRENIYEVIVETTRIYAVDILYDNIESWKM